MPLPSHEWARDVTRPRAREPGFLLAQEYQRAVRGDIARLGAYHTRPIHLAEGFAAGWFPSGKTGSWGFVQ